MKNKALFFIISLFFSSGCAFKKTKALDLKAFTIEVPRKWTFQPIRGIDSYVGEIGDANLKLTFDYSNQGYASGLIFTEQEYVNALVDRFESCTTCIPEYDNTVDFDRIQTLIQIKRKNPNFRKSVFKVLIDTVNNRDKLPSKADYKLYVFRNRKTDTVLVTIPQEIKNTIIQIDTVDNKIRKIVFPKKGLQGITGIYFESLKTNFNFHMVGKNLSYINQQVAITAFKTIKFNP